MGFWELMERFVAGDLDDEQVVGQLDRWLHELESVFEGVEALPQKDPMVEGALSALDRCNSLVHDLIEAVEGEDYDSVEELVEPAGKSLEACYQNLAALKSKYPPPSVMRLFDQVDRLLAGEPILDQVLAQLDKIDRESQELRQMQSDDDEVQGLLLKAAASVDQGLNTLREGARELDANKVSLGKEFFQAATFALAEARSGQASG